MDKTTIKWDLSDLYSGMDAPRIEETLATQLRRPRSSQAAIERR